MCEVEICAIGVADDIEGAGMDAAMGMNGSKRSGMGEVDDKNTSVGAQTTGTGRSGTNKFDENSFEAGGSTGMMDSLRTNCLSFRRVSISRSSFAMRSSSVCDVFTKCEVSIGDDAKLCDGAKLYMKVGAMGGRRISTNPFVDSVFDTSSWKISRDELSVRKDDFAFSVLDTLSVVNVLLAN